MTLIQTAASIVMHGPISPLHSFSMKEPDSILGLNKLFKADKRNPIGLHIGVCSNEQGQLGVFEFLCVERQQVAAGDPKNVGYLPPEGLASFNRGAQIYLLGDDSPAIKEGRIVTMQALGGAGSLAQIARAFHILSKETGGYAPLVLAPNITWPPHFSIFREEGLPVQGYPIYDVSSHCLTHAQALGSWKEAVDTNKGRTILIIVQPSSPNPYSIRNTLKQWDEMANFAAENQANVVFVFDIPYQGLGRNPEADADPIRLWDRRQIPCVVAQSFSKIADQYKQRVGATHFLLGDSRYAAALESNLLLRVRNMYSSPPAFGAETMVKIFENHERYRIWLQTLAQARDYINGQRAWFVNAAKDLGSSCCNHLADGEGLFGLISVKPGSIEALREEKGIYLVEIGRELARINFAALTPSNRDRAVEEIVKIVA